MTLEKEIIIRVLVIEDDPKQLEAMELYLHNISWENLQPLGVDRLQIDKASSENKANEHLDRAEKSGTPYDLCMLDLSLPQVEGAAPEKPEKGFEILKRAIEKNTVRKVIVVSAFKDYTYIAGAFHGGAFDFVAKPFESHPLQTMVLNCLRHMMIEQSRIIFNERVKRLVQYAELGLAHRFTKIFSGLIDGISRSAREIEKYTRDNLNLDPARNSQDLLVSQLRKQRESINIARDEWVKQKSLLLAEDEKPVEREIAELIRSVHSELLRCLSVKRTRLSIISIPDENLPVITFQDDVEQVMKEIVAGALCEVEDYGDQHQIGITVRRNGDWALVTFEDDLKQISTEDADAINTGYSIVSGMNFKRKWGLSIAQHIAGRSNGYLKVLPKDHGNVITYEIPLKGHA